MTHDDVQAALAAEALGALDGDEREQVHAHLAGCPECRAELEELREAAALLAHAAPHRPLERARSDRLRARLLARAAADRQQPAPQVVSLASRRRSPLPAWLAAAASLLLAIGLGVYASTLRGRVASLEDRNAALSSTLERRESTLAALAGPEVRVIDLASSEQREPSGRMFWNPHRRRYTFYAYNLPPVREGREYQLWLITPQGPVAAPTFPTRDGMGSVESGYDVPNEQIRAFAVTDEPVGGLPKPTGEVVIVGTTTE
jgi:anti-sigma-K factor RskA